MCPRLSLRPSIIKPRYDLTPCPPSWVQSSVNKSVIGGRMKGSGMHWSRSGASNMAALRAYGDNRTPLIPFDTIRHAAYPIPA